jgi:hypothetical protein
MVRMLGFSEEDKRRVGMAQQNARGGGMVRSVFGVPGRIVGGILGSSDSETTSPRAAPGDNQVCSLLLSVSSLVKTSILPTIWDFCFGFKVETPTSNTPTWDPFSMINLELPYTLKYT